MYPLHNCIDYILYFDKEANWSIESSRKRAVWKQIYQKPDQGHKGRTDLVKSFMPHFDL